MGMSKYTNSISNNEQLDSNSENKSSFSFYYAPQCYTTFCYETVLILEGVKYLPRSDILSLLAPYVQGETGLIR